MTAKTKTAKTKSKAEPSPAKRGRGQPTAYKPEFAEQARKLCAMGATDDELSEFFKLSTRTIYRWANVHPDFCQALKAGKEACDERVVRSLYHRAVGYTHDAEKILTVGGKVRRVPFKEHVPPDPTSALFWLKNRRRHEWRDRHEHEVGKPGEFDQLSDDELLRIATGGSGDADTTTTSQEKPDRVRH